MSVNLRYLMIRMGYWFVFLILLTSPKIASPHADLELQIEAVTAKIVADPGNFSLYAKRGELYRQHANYPAALRDFEKFSNITPKDNIAEFLIGRTLLESGQADQAVPHLENFLLHNPSHPAALLAFARTLSDLGRIDEASDYYRRSIKNAPVKIPGQYIEWSRVYLQPDHERPVDALDVLEQGITQIGPVVSLVDHAVSLQQRIGDFHGAIRYVKMLPDELQTTPKWLVKQADCIYALGDLQQSSHLYHQALQKITALPHARREVPAMRELTIYINAKLSS
jgi:tetratricopeptide (TPR) repeat protein